MNDTPYNGSENGYGAPIDAIVYDSPATCDFTAADWLKLAFAALDQAGATANLQARVRAIIVKELP